ncbi:uncharacterized protein LOC143549614 [Bidens hawaiensis]|uniref:uncharacterized protein LOC143549614 n=1 Tax=Bidens hawaiensis TaxID=980011 RepID=UPI00404A3204
MGICSSSDIATSVSVTTTAKLILHDGTLQEYSYPVKVSHVLQKHPLFFICNSDEMEFDDVATAIRDDDVLQPGQLYFALPVSRLRCRLQPQEMAALAVKASHALDKSGGGGERCGCSGKNVYFMKGSGRVLDGGSVGGGRRRDVIGRLSVIPE